MSKYRYKSDTSFFKGRRNISSVRKNNVAAKYKGIRPAMLKPTAYKEASGDRWYVYKFLIGHDPTIRSSVNFYKRRR